MVLLRLWKTQAAGVSNGVGFFLQIFPSSLNFCSPFLNFPFSPLISSFIVSVFQIRFMYTSLDELLHSCPKVSSSHCISGLYLTFTGAGREPRSFPIPDIFPAEQPRNDRCCFGLPLRPFHILGSSPDTSPLLGFGEQVPVIFGIFMIRGS